MTSLLLAPLLAVPLFLLSESAVSADPPPSAEAQRAAESDLVTQPGRGEDSAPVPVEPASPSTPFTFPWRRAALPPPVPEIVGAPRAASAPRQSLAARLEPLWIDLTPAQQEALAPFAPEWNTWPAAEKKSWIALADKLPGMSTEKRRLAQARILEWSNLSPAQRRLARENYRLAKKRTVEQRADEWRNYQSLTQEQQAVLRHAGRTSNTAAAHAGVPTGLAREASQPLPRFDPGPPRPLLELVPASATPRGAAGASANDPR